MADNLNPAPIRPKPILSKTNQLSLSHASQALTTGSDTRHKNIIPAPVALFAQKGLTISQSTGIKAVEHILLANNGDLSSGASLSPPSSRANDNSDPVAPPSQIGRASNARPMTRATTAPAGVFSPAGTPPVLPIVSTPVNPSPSTPISTFDHFKLKSAFKTETIHATARDVANLMSEVRLRQPVHPESSPPLTWENLYGVDASRSRSTSQSRSEPGSVERLPSGDDDSVRGRLEDLEFEADTAIKDIVARVSALKEQGSLSSGTAAITVTELHKGVVENIQAIMGDLEVLNEEIYVRAEEQTKAVAALSVKSKALEDANKTLSAENSQLRSDLKAVQAAIACLELAPPPPLLLRSQRDPESHAQHPAHHSISPPPHHSQSRWNRDEDNGYISLGPVGESAETPTRLFELHLRTAIPNFHLEVPYAVELDPTYRDHLRVTVKSEAVARSLTDAWVRNTMAGYAKIKMVQMRSAGGNQSAEINSYPNTWANSNGTRSYQGNATASSSHAARYSQPGRR
ncbi:hypothetical protein B0H13DRAFT_2315986 [Mycena leptocephala]|nr:hypothetical protein B0H13DRAFT_2315986 [Mycena leptocephala]